MVSTEDLFPGQTKMKSFVLAFVCLGQVLQVASQSITAPEAVVAERPLTLECKTTRPTGDRSLVTWYRDVGQNRSRIYASRVCTSPILVSLSSPAGLSGGCQHVNGEEVYTVTIENVTENAGRGRWTCQYGRRSDNVILDVKVMVTRVNLTNPPAAVLAGDPINFTCVTSASKPQACIKAYIRSSGNVREIDPLADCSQDSSSVQTTTRTLTFTASAEENEAELYCNASNNVTDHPVRSQLHTLNVQYGPLFTSCKSSYIFVENTTARLSCTIWANPEPRFTWSPGAHLVMNEAESTPDHRYTSVVRFDKISRNDSGVYTVTASNNVTRSVERTVNVTVYYPPTVSVVLASGTVTEGKALQLECRAEAVPQNFSYSAWSRTIGDRSVTLKSNGSGNSLSINQVTFRDQGVYGCGVSNGFGGVQGGQLDVKVRARPQFPNQINQQAAAIGESVKLMFKFVSHPPYVNITWYKLSNGTAERLSVPNTTGSKYRRHVTKAEHKFLFYNTEVLLPGHVVELEISDVNRDDIGDYKFIVENDVGSSAFHVNLIGSVAHEDNLSHLAASVAGGFSGAIVLLGVSLVGVVILCKRKGGKRSSRDNEDQPNQQEMAENPSMAAPVYQTLNLSPSSPEVPDYANSVAIPEHANTSVTTAENDHTDPGYERLRANAAAMLDTNRRVPPNHQEMAENPSMAGPVNPNLNLSASSPDVPVYVDLVPTPEFENTSITTTGNDPTDPGYERPRTNAAPMLDTNRQYENTRLF